MDQKDRKRPTLKIRFVKDLASLSGGSPMLPAGFQDEIVGICLVDPPPLHNVLKPAEQKSLTEIALEAGFAAKTAEVDQLLATIVELKKTNEELGIENALLTEENTRLRTERDRAIKESDDHQLALLEVKEDLATITEKVRLASVGDASEEHC